MFTDAVGKDARAKETSVLLVQYLVELLKSLCWFRSLCISRGSSIRDFQTKEDHDITQKATTTTKSRKEKEKINNPLSHSQ